LWKHGRSALLADTLRVLRNVTPKVGQTELGLEFVRFAGRLRPDSGGNTRANSKLLLRARCGLHPEWKANVVSSAQMEQLFAYGVPKDLHIWGAPVDWFSDCARIERSTFRCCHDAVPSLAPTGAVVASPEESA
jgi:hypothetical protein